MRALMLPAGQSFVPRILEFGCPIQSSVKRWVLKPLILEPDGDHSDRPTRNTYQEMRLKCNPGRGGLSAV